MLALGAACVFAVPRPCAAQASSLDEASYRQLSKQMRLAVDLYERGDDLEAMDRFMEVLMRGNPNERPMANDYLNLISQRMAIGTRLPEQSIRRPGATTIEREDAKPRVRQEEPARPRRRDPSKLIQEYPPAPAPKRADPMPRRPRGDYEPKRRKLSREDRRLMKKEIDGKIRARSRSLLGALRRWEDITVRMANSRLPRAIGIPPSLLYESDLRFKKDSGKILDLLSELVFSLGATQVVILPEGAILGEAKIMDMRRTMGISSHLLKAGIAPARLRVNLLSTQVDVPQDLTNYKGVLLVFVYNQPLTLSTENEVGAEAGPPLSLGISPESLDPREGDGVIIEFSVMEPPAGLMSWRFQLRGATEEGGDFAPLQEVKGSAPVFHQIYWNGRRRYFGENFPPGRYEAVLSATDMKNRTRKLRSWIKVTGAESVAAAATATASVANDASAAPPPDALPGAEKASSRVVKKRRGRTVKKRPSRKDRAKKRRSRRSRRSTPKKKVAKKTIQAPAKSAPPAEAPGGGEAPAADGGSRAGAVNYQVLFDKNTANVTPEGDNILQRVADTMHYYPLDNINLVGYSYTGESDPEKLAVRRAQLVSKLLVERHQMKRERIQVDTKTVDYETAKVEIYIVAGGQ
jgi:outer membrane protein OmpA-like peptidoglycan-associated protein